MGGIMDVMGGTVNNFGDPCPACSGRNKVEHQAVKPAITKDGTIVMPHLYGVCDECHREQYKDVYGFYPDESQTPSPIELEIINTPIAGVGTVTAPPSE